MFSMDGIACSKLAIAIKINIKPEWTRRPADRF
jgi:hypothetical protein